MFTRCAIFEGRILDGREDEFFARIEANLLPLWRQFPHALDVRLLRPVQADSDAPPIVAVQEIDYPSLAAIEEALSSSIRTQARAETMKLMDIFSGRFFHLICRPT